MEQESGKLLRILVADEVEPRQQATRIEVETIETLEKIKESLVFAYLTASLKNESIPLKSFMDGFEKNILLACLRLTQGNQKNAATVLNLKPTALFEKMRKHGIRSQRGKLPGENWSRLINSSEN